MNKLGIGYSPLSDTVYLGKQNEAKRTWVGNKDDITNQFLAVSVEFFKENTIRDISDGDNPSNLIINIKKDKESINRVIESLKKISEEI